MKTIWILVLLTVAISANALEDSPENRRIEAERYLEVVPPAELMADAAKNMAMNLPPEDRLRFRELMTKYLDIDVINQAMVDSMVRHLAADEIKALADFYGSAEGKSAMKKFGAYMADVMPIVESEVLKAQAEALKAQAEANRQLPDVEE